MGTVRKPSPLTQPDKGWAWAVMLSSFGAHLISGGFLYTVGVIHSSLLERFQEDIKTTSWAGTIFLFGTSVSSPLAGIIINNYSCRVAMYVGAIISTSGFVASALVKSLNWIMITFGAVAGFGVGISYSAHVIVLGFNFNKNVNLATGVASAGIALGTFVFAPLIQATRDHYGDAGMFFVCAGISFHYNVFGTLFFPSELEYSMRQNHLHRRSEKCNTQSIKHFCNVFSNLSLMCLSFSMFFATSSICLLYLHFPEFAIQKGSTPIEASLLLSINGVSSLVIRPLVGVAANEENIDEELLFSGASAFLGLGALLLPMYGGTYVGQIVFAVVLGYIGCFYVLLNSLCLKCVQKTDLAIAYGIVVLLSGFGSIIGPPIAGYIIGSGGTYAESFVFAGSALQVAALLGILTVCFYKKDPKAIKKDINIDIVCPSDTLLEH